MKDDKNKTYLSDNHGNYITITNLNDKSIYALGAGGRGFESRYPDTKNSHLQYFVNGCFFCFTYSFLKLFSSTFFGLSSSLGTRCNRASAKGRSHYAIGTHSQFIYLRFKLRY